MSEFYRFLQRALVFQFNSTIGDLTYCNIVRVGRDIDLKIASRLEKKIR